MELEERSGVRCLFILRREEDLWRLGQERAGDEKTEGERDGEPCGRRGDSDGVGGLQLE